MSDPADSPAPRSEDAEGRAASGEAPPEPPRPETPMEDSRPEAAEEPSAPAPAEPVREEPARAEPEPARAEQSQPEPARAEPSQPEPALAAGASPSAQAASPQHRYPQRPPYQQAQQAAYYRQAAAPPVLLPPNPRWHRPDSVPKQAVVLMAFVVAAFGAWTALHSDGVGIGLALTGIAMVALPLAAGDRSDLVPRLPGAALVAALWSVAAIRDAGWVVILCSAAAFLLTPLVLAPQRRFGGTLLTLLAGWLEGLAETFKWARRHRRDKDGRDPATVRNLWVALVTAVLLLVFGGLFAAADSTFADLIARLLPEVDPLEFFLRLLLAAVLFPLVLLWTYTAVAKPSFDSETSGPGRTVSRFELAVPLGALNLLFAAFIAVQLRVYLGGEGYVRETVGLTFAEYARQGFWQLSVVAVLSLAVIAIAAWLAPKRAKADRWTARVLLGMLCVLSMVVSASALLRMHTYFEAFGLTRMRIWVFTVEIWLAILFALVIVCCWKLRATWLPRAVLASGGLTLLGLAAVNPDALIARYNLEHDRKLDLDYLEGLSADAVPELSDDHACAVAGMEYRWKDREPLAWNWGVQRAMEAAEDADGASCRSHSSDLGLDGHEEDRPSGTAEPSASEEFFTVESCDAYDLTSAAELFGTSATGDYGLEADDSSQFVNSPSPDYADGWYLQCGYYGPGGRYLLVEVTQWESATVAVDSVRDRRASYEASGGAEAIDDLGSETVEGFTAWYESPRTHYYVVAYEELEIVVRLMESAVDASAAAVGADLADQTYERYLEFS
ncbi:DUF4173 domain-containing protein [Glycomyces sp. TRM65418]|uniref:DUF4153 domain-containing protein n=1 Tax=Glycomyces sp. TRM65418 TaxID=2867006 RepID=UPI001CE63E7B|nr:DUF4173 domain-containing protein [Glycomyces sp. TRM65418]MCC3765389.1 DUF4173 domain-containing protein [Glycomyces sp. TRM65418]QZD55003.1 DUF4173 domain-containing protein [Glycomyces sp. TRM65418]